MPDPEPYDQRFYWGPGLPKDHGQLVEQWVAQTRTTAGTLLAPSDWMVIRKVERNVDIPAETTTFRDAVVTECNRLETAINAATTVEELITALGTANWPVTA